MSDEQPAFISSAAAGAFPALKRYAAMHGVRDENGRLAEVHNGQRAGCPLCPQLEKTVALVVTSIDHERGIITLEAEKP